MEELELIPNVSFGMFVLGDSIDKYLSLSHTVEHIEDEFFLMMTTSFQNCMYPCGWRIKKLILFAVKHIVSGRMKI